MCHNNQVLFHKLTRSKISATLTGRKDSDETRDKKAKHKWVVC